MNGKHLKQSHTSDTHTHKQETLPQTHTNFNIVLCCLTHTHICTTLTQTHTNKEKKNHELLPHTPPHSYRHIHTYIHKHDVLQQLTHTNAHTGTCPPPVWVVWPPHPDLSGFNQPAAEVFSFLYSLKGDDNSYSRDGGSPLVCFIRESIMILQSQHQENTQPNNYFPPNGSAYTLLWLLS